jgi:hypothetical protein
MSVKPPDSVNRFQDSENAGWKSCRVCGTQEFRAIVYFDTGTVAPTADAYSTVTKTWTGGEVVTGTTSGHTGIVHKVYLRSGSYAGGDAAGCLELRSPSGFNRENWTVFQKNEALTGASAFRAAVIPDHPGSVVVNGNLYPIGDLVYYRGDYYCAPHFAWRFGHEWATDSTFKSSLEKTREF